METQFVYQHEFFNSNLYHVDSMLSAFSENIMDISLNELSVHYLGNNKKKKSSKKFKKNIYKFKNNIKYLYKRKFSKIYNFLYSLL
jgi:hypothetical protein